MKRKASELKAQKAKAHARKRAARDEKAAMLLKEQGKDPGVSMQAVESAHGNSSGTGAVAQVADESTALLSSPKI